MRPRGNLGGNIRVGATRASGLTATGLLLTFTLSACGLLAPKPGVAPKPPPPPPVEAGPPQPKPRPRARWRTPLPLERPDSLPAAAESGAGAPPPPPRPTLESLTGLGGDQVQALLGQPDAKTETPPAQVWHYQSVDCSLELFFYLDVASNRFQVLKVRSDNAPAGDEAAASAITAEQCLESVIDERHASP